MQINQNLLKDLQRKGIKKGNIRDLVRKSQTIDRSMLRKRNINVRKSTAQRQLLDPTLEKQSTEKNIRIRTVRQQQAEKEIEFLQAKEKKVRPQTARFEPKQEDHLLIPEFQIENLFEGMANRITEQIITDITGKDQQQFKEIVKIKFKRDLTLNSLQDAGLILPQLQVLKLNGSNIQTLRDIGTSFKHLQALYVSRCNIVELSGLICFPKLQELYASFNNIKDLRPISDSYNLQVLDLEGNEVDDIKQLNNFDFSHRLRNLNILNNKINSNVTQKLLLEKLKNLKTLNDVSREEALSKISQYKKQAKQTEVKYNIGCLKNLCREFSQLDVLRKSKIFKGSFKQVLKDQCQMKKKEEPVDEEILIRTIKQRKKKFTGSRSNENELNITIQNFMNTTMTQSYNYMRPQTSQQSRTSMVGNFTQLFDTPKKQQQDKHQFINTDKNTMSDLTIGADEAFIGNPLKAMRFKRKKQFINDAKTKDGTKVVQEKGFLELFDEFNKNNNEEMSSENVSLDSFEINNYKDEDEEEEEEKQPDQPEWQLPLLDEEKYILGSDNEDEDKPKEKPPPLQYRAQEKRQKRLENKPEMGDNFFEHQPLPQQEPFLQQSQQFSQSPILPMRKYKTFQAKPGQKLIPSQGKINFQQKQSVKPFNQMNFQKSKLFQKPFMKPTNKVKRFRVSNKKLQRMGTAPVQTRPVPPQQKQKQLVSHKKPFRIKPIGLKELQNKKLKKYKRPQPPQ